MIRPRVIPALLLKGGGLVKTVKFKEPKYLGDPINIVRIFNDKEVDELVLLDIAATPENRGPQFDLLKNIASEAFIPLAYGGGIRNMDDVRKLLSIGIEKLIMNTSAVETPSLIREVADHAGSQAAVASIDVKKNFLGKYEVFTRCGQKKTGLDPVKHAVEMEKMGAGEIIINSIDRDGTMQGYDVELVRRVADSVRVPVVACGGAGNLSHVSEVIKQGRASAAAAGSIFVFHGPLRGVLISYPAPKELKEFV
ncbi:MAG: glycosyl amidation-associated protein WbuZ [Chloroflexi bacterium CFX1]|nr:glycosyl amidation-associated protein WbuZ [Chloroflexi bacterium CFX1]MDL1918206.1 glycosyl amidation-associated protein WbuZ [Chloroflexi bacterium CFX5]NUQ59747.1 imidazole glycerol phosphate synthase subunit HisF [Anaerolineales bacterium]